MKNRALARTAPSWDSEWASAVMYPLEELRDDLGNCLLRLSDIDDAYWDAYCFKFIYSSCNDMEVLHSVLPENYLDASCALRFAKMLDHPKPSKYLEDLVNETNFIPNEYKGMIDWEELSDVVSAVDRAQFTSSLDKIIELFTNDWNSDKSIINAATALAQKTCPIEVVDDEKYYARLAPLVEKIDDYEERLHSRHFAGTNSSHRDLAKLGHRYLFMKSRMPAPPRETLVDIHKIYNTKMQRFFSARYLDGTQILNEDMTEILGEWRTEPRFNGLFPNLRRIEDMRAYIPTKTK